MSNREIFQIMHSEKIVAEISTSGQAFIADKEFMPYDLYFEIETDIDSLLNNLVNFYHWCASRVLSLDRKYAKEILNSIGAVQATTDKDRAEIAMSYHCVSLTDVYWVRKKGEVVSFMDINLYKNPLNAAIVDISLRGKQMTVTNQELAPDLSTKGCFPKAWIRTESGFRLLKAGGEDAVRREVLASEICRCFDIPQVVYRMGIYDGEVVSESEIVSSLEYSLVSKISFDIFAANHDLNTLEVCKELDPMSYYGMNILDYLIGNTDRHPENWGFLVDNRTNRYISLYPLMDFNQCFRSYEQIEGANCQTVYPQKMTQLEAAMEAVEKIGLGWMKKNVDMAIFEDKKAWGEMFQKRMGLLRRSCN